MAATSTLTLTPHVMGVIDGTSRPMPDVLHAHGWAVSKNHPMFSGPLRLRIGDLFHEVMIVQRKDVKAAYGNQPQLSLSGWEFTCTISAEALEAVLEMYLFGTWHAVFNFPF